MRCWKVQVSRSWVCWVLISTCPGQILHVHIPCNTSMKGKLEKAGGGVSVPTYCGPGINNYSTVHSTDGSRVLDQ
jgi:hypothetical protein